MLDHGFLSVSDVPRSIRFYEEVLTPLAITARLDYDGKDGPLGHPDLQGLWRQWPYVFLVARKASTRARGSRRFCRHEEGAGGRSPCSRHAARCGRQSAQSSRSDFVW